MRNLPRDGMHAQRGGNMKFTLRHIVLGSIVIAMCILALSGFAFTFLSLDLNEVLGIMTDSIRLDTISENAFDLMDGKSGLLSFYDTMRTALLTDASIANRSWPDMVDTVVLVKVLQGLSISLVVLTAALLIVSIVWFFVAKTEKGFKIISILACVAGFVYLAMGIVFTCILNADWNNIVEAINTTAAAMIGNIFSTLAFVPFILIAVFAAAFWALYKILKNPAPREKAVAAEGGALPAADRRAKKRAVRQGERAEAEEALSRIETMHAALFKLKELLDAGLITQEEFDRQKEKILNE